MTERSGVADRLYGLLVRIFAVSPPLSIVGWDGSQAGACDGPVLRVRSRKAVRRLLWSPGELGLARAYVAGELDIDGDLIEAMRQLAEFGALARAKESLAPTDRRDVLRTAVLLGAVGPPPKAPLEEFVPGREQSTDGRAVGAMNHDEELIRALLGESRTYSCASWGEGVVTLDDAQCEKLDRICRSLDLRPGARFLDLGCGWGGLLLHAARHYDVTAVGVVRSAERADLVRSAVAAAGLDGRVDVRLGGPVDIADGPYDAIADIESQDQSPAYAAAVGRLLGPGGRLLQQQIAPLRVVPDDASFLRSYVHPSTTLIPLSRTLEAWEDAGLELRSVQTMREHYPPTFRAWAANLDREWERVRAAVGERQARVWRLSLALAVVGFERGRVSVYQALAVRPHAHGEPGLASSA